MLGAESLGSLTESPRNTGHKDPPICDTRCFEPRSQSTTRASDLTLAKKGEFAFRPQPINKRLGAERDKRLTSKAISVTTECQVEPSFLFRQGTLPRASRRTISANRSLNLQKIGGRRP